MSGGQDWAQELTRSEPASKRVYIAGPMTDMPDHNFPAFHAAAKRFRDAGWEVVNPAENFGGNITLPRWRYMRKDIAALTQCDAIALLPGWWRSRGATLEYQVAIECGLAIYNAETMKREYAGTQALDEKTAAA